VSEPTSTVIEGWIQRIQAGDRAARDELLRAVERRLSELSSRMLRKYPTVRRYAETGDVYQTACLRLLRALEEVKPTTTREFFALAAVQIRRALLDLARYYATPGRSFVPEPGGDDESGAGWEQPAAEPAADDLDRWGRFHEAVEKLPAEEREVVGLRFYHGWHEARIADLLQVNVRTVQRWWKSALGKLKDEVGDPG
jgi:RNA polymerase sigma-70 factor (ECF subfamily)